MGSAQPRAIIFCFSSPIQDTLMTDLPNIPYVPPPRTPSYYLALLCVVIPLWLVTPLSWSFIIYTLYNAKLSHYGWNTTLCFAVALCEVCAFSSDHHPLILLPRSYSVFTITSSFDPSQGFPRVAQATLRSFRLVSNAS